MEGVIKFLASDQFWMGFSIVGNAVFGLAFVIQWLASEKRKRSHIPISFWYVRIVGSILLLIWAIQLCFKTVQSLVLVMAYSANCLFYVRNLVLIHRRRALIAAGMVEADKWEDT